MIPLTDVLGHIDTNLTDSTIKSGYIDSPGDDSILDIFSLLIDAFKSNTVTASIDTVWFELQNLLISWSMAEVDGNRSDALRFRKSLRDIVYTVDSNRTSDESGICAEKPHRTCAHSQRYF
jgi:hypothetical protein